MPVATCAEVEATLFEREEALTAVGDALATAIRGDGSLVLVEGPAGIGKTRLLAHLVALAQERKLRVLRASGAEFETRFPFGVARQLFERVAHALPSTERRRMARSPSRQALALLDSPGALAPVAGEPDTTYLIVHGLYWLTVDLTSRGPPMVLAVDDAHWADEPSLRAIAYVARRLDGLPVVLAVAARSGHWGDSAVVLDAVRREPRAQRLQLSPLTPPAAAAVVEQLTGTRLDVEAAEACYAVSHGNPFLLGELARALRSDGVPPTAASIRALEELAPDSLVQAVMMRLGTMSAEAVAFAHALVVLGDRAPLELVAEVAGISPARARANAGALVDAGILGSGPAASFVHPLVRAAVHADLMPFERQEAHERAYRVLSGRMGDVEMLANHLMHCAPRGDGQRAARLRSAAQLRSLRGAHASAAGLLRRALAEPPAAELRAAILLEAGLAELQAGEVVEAAEHLRGALALPLDPDARMDAAIALARALAAAGLTREAVAALEAAAAGLDDERRLRLDVEATTLAIYVEDLAVGAQRRMREYASLPGDSPAERIALANAALAFGFHPDSVAEEVVDIARRALGEGRLVAEQGCNAPSIGQATYPLMFAGELDTIERVMDAIHRDAIATGSAFGLMSAHMGRGMVAGDRGELAVAIAEGEAAWRIVSELPASLVVQRWRAALVRFLCEAIVERGDLGEAEGLLGTATAGLDLGRPEHVLLHHALGLVALAREDWRAALEEFLAYGAVARAVGYEERTTRWRLGAARAAVAVGDAARATDLADEELALAERWGAPGGLGAAQHVRGLVGPPGEARGWLERSVASLEASPNRLALAHALVDLGVARRRAGQRAEARSPLARGLDLASRCGARPLVERARAELLIAGARPRRDRLTGRDALTPTERRIAELAAARRTNREIAQELYVTPKTVETHLSVVYRKLGIFGRGSLRQALESHPG